MDKSLDDIIKSKRTPRAGARRPRRAGGARAAILGNTTTPGPAARARYQNTLPAANGAPPTQNVNADKIIVSNLPLDVNEAQVKELFSSTVGPLRDVTLHYDSNGKSKGTASVQFSKKGDGNKAYAQYNNRLIDGKRPMKIEIVLGPAPPPSLASRVAPATTVAPMEGVEAPTTRPPRTGRPGRGRGRGRRNRGTERPAKTAEELDTEMEDYTKTDAVAPAVATTAA